jgi:two-component system chemotaxis sensor kinase CheA
VVQYRDHILPLTSLREVLEPGGQDREAAADPVQVIVFNDGDRSLGVVVDQILDVAEEVVTVRQRSNRKGLLGSAVVGKRVTDLLDLNYVLSLSGEDWSQSRRAPANNRIVLVAEASAFWRGLIRSGLDMAGYCILEAANLDEAIGELEQHPVDMVVAAMDLPPEGGPALRAAMRARPEWRGIPVLALTESAEQLRMLAGATGSFDDCQTKFNREAMLASVARLTAVQRTAETASVCVGEER